LLAIAPNANIGLVAGTSTGIDPRFAQIFSRNTLGGKHLELNTNLVQRLKNLQLWEKTRDDLLANYGDISGFKYLPTDLKDIFKDSFSVNPAAFVEVAARAQKWVDQAISRNIYLATRDIDEVMAVYLAAWESGVKTTYYLHMKPRHSAEQSTVKINKSTGMGGKRGFGAALDNKVVDEVNKIAVDQPDQMVPAARHDSVVSPVKRGFGAVLQTQATEAVSIPVEVTPIVYQASPTPQPEKFQACPTDPQERLMCESCQ
jgi:ribonucleoside-diphosphate reductase alpha chain